uniref:Cytochrome c oxidase subunit 7A1, mitochondrial n=2 Tax=Ailuropoda melanoleuca TaxID=9646 RepID=G1L2I3_AILME
MYCLVPFSSPLGPAEIASNRWDASDLSARGRDWSDPSPGLLHESESGGGISPASPTPRPPPQTPGEAVTRRAEGVAWDSRGGEGAVCPWAERGGDSGRRGRRMRGLRVSQALVRSFSSTARNRFQNRVAEKQKLFQADNDLPVHLKGGGTDNILYRVTMGLCVGGTAYSLYCLGWASFPHKK